MYLKFRIETVYAPSPHPVKMRHVLGYVLPRFPGLLHSLWVLFRRPSCARIIFLQTSGLSPWLHIIIWSLVDSEWFTNTFNTSCVCTLPCQWIMISAEFSESFQSFHINGICTAWQFRLSHVKILKLWVIGLGILSAFWAWSRTSSCLDFYFSRYIYCTLSVDVVELSIVPKVGAFGGF